MLPNTVAIDLLPEASQRLIRTVDGLDAERWSGPSTLPGWTRGHVVAHLALNAEGLAAALREIVADEPDEPIAMYVSQEARDSDIEKLAGADRHEVRDRLLAATTEFADAVAAVPEDRWDRKIDRTRGNRPFRASSAIGMRLREVEIHHVDLAAAYTRADWPLPFSELLLDAMTKRHPAAQPFRAHATDADRTWAFGEGGPTVSGTAADLAWWLTGRGVGEGLTSDDGELPGIEAW